MILVVDKAVRSALINDATVFGLSDNRVYKTQAPSKVSDPYIVFEYVAGGSENFTSIDSMDLQYRVRAISQNRLEADQLADAIRAALHEATLTYDSPWFHVRCQSMDGFRMVDQVENRQYTIVGHEFRIRLSKHS